MQTKSDIERQLLEAKHRLVQIEGERDTILRTIATLQGQKKTSEETSAPVTNTHICNGSSPDEKIALFRSLFRGREDVFPRRFESQRTGKSGYQPACRNEWVRGVCGKPKIRCGECDAREFLPVTDEIVRCHLSGFESKNRIPHEFVMGVYPMLDDETCWLLAADFDKEEWQPDIGAFRNTCNKHGIPIAIERSRSGNGGHAWMFFAEPVPAVLARKLGAFLLTDTMEDRPEIGFDSYDRFFPNQDTMPKGGFGNLIALPLQKKSRERGNSVFLNQLFEPYADQWAFLSMIVRVSRSQIECIVEDAARRGKIVGVRMVVTDEDEDAPWTLPPSKRHREEPLSGPLPQNVELVLSNQIFIPKASVPKALVNRLVRIAAFQNPEFYRAQAMRLSVYDKPRIISCAEDFPKHVGLPRGCADDVFALLKHLGIGAEINDQRFGGVPLNVVFNGELWPEQQKAVSALLKNEMGVLSASTAFGKTVVAAYLIAERNANTLILVHRRQLLDQWKERLKTFLKIDPKQIGIFGGGRKKATGIIDIAIIQSLVKKGVVDDLIGNYGHVIVDECHHISAPAFEQVARLAKAKYVTGLSATVTRKDGHHPIIFMQCGPVRYRVDDRAQATLRPFLHRVIPRETGFALPEDLNSERPGIQDVYAALASNGPRNEMIVQDILLAVQMNRSPVVLSERKEHIDLLAEKLSRSINNVIVIKGGMGEKLRKTISARIASIPVDEPRVLLSTGRYLGEGFDDARLDTLFLTLPVSWKGVLAQYAGRLHRLYATKHEVIIHDYVDSKVPVLARMLEKRRKGYRAIGYEVEG